MTAKSAAAQVSDIAGLIKEDMEYVMRESISDVLVAAQTTQIGITQGATGFVEGKIPVGLTAELVNSLTVDGATGPDSYVVAIANMQIGDVTRFAWTAPHALPMETGFTAANGRQVPGRHFVGKNAAEFPDHVRKRAAEVRR